MKKLLLIILLAGFGLSAWIASAAPSAFQTPTIGAKGSTTTNAVPSLKHHRRHHHHRHHRRWLRRHHRRHHHRRHHARHHKKKAARTAQPVPTPSTPTSGVEIK